MAKEIEKSKAKKGNKIGKPSIKKQEKISKTKSVQKYGKKLLSPRRSLTPEELQNYHRDGYLVINSMFTTEEAKLIQDTVEQDIVGNSKSYQRKDKTGRGSKMILWYNLGKDTYGAFARSHSMVSAAQKIFDGDQPYHFHTKLMMKEPKVGGAWEWHQDFGYWYEDGLLHAGGSVTACIAIDNHTEANGCLQVLKGSHKLGRLTHGIFGDQSCADPSRLEAVKNLKDKQGKNLYPLRHLEMKAGSVFFLHPNTLHCSAPNNSEDWRRSQIVVYNSKENQPIKGFTKVPKFTPLQLIPDEKLLKYGIKTHSQENKSFNDPKDKRDRAHLERFDNQK